MSVLLLSAFLAAPQDAPPPTYDVVVYGGTAGGIVAAIAADRQGARVALVEPGRFLGGMVTGGLGRTDFGNRDTVGGMSLEFFRRLGKHYGQDIAWFFEPSVATTTFHDWLAETGVTVLREHRLLGVDKAGARIDTLRTTGGTVAGAVFLDATYEGDLFAAAGASYHVGRESRRTYGEPLAGVRPVTPKHQFTVPVDGRADGALLPLVNRPPYGDPGAGDGKIQAYNFRLCLSTAPANRIPFTRPPRYDAARYELLARYFAKRADLRLDEVLSIAEMPNSKTDINNNGAFSTDHVGANWDYPEADHDRRTEIVADHEDYTRGLIWFLATDPRVPEPVREDMNRYGFAADEFADNGHWTHQLYVREGRRLVGEHVMTQFDCQRDIVKPDSVGMGSYNIDTHNAQRLLDADGHARNEGDVQVGVPPYEIPYRSLLPRRDQVANLLVPVCVSSSHLAYGSIRMEPVYMLLGQAAGTAAAMSLPEGRVHDIDVPALQETLRAAGQVLSHTPADAVRPADLPGVVVDDAAAQLAGPWSPSRSVPPYVGIGYVHNGAAGAGRAVFAPPRPLAGRHRVRLYYSAHAMRTAAVTATVHHAAGATSVTIDQTRRTGSADQPAAADLGAFDRPSRVVLDATGTTGHVTIDAVGFEPEHGPRRRPPPRGGQGPGRAARCSSAGGSSGMRPGTARREANGPNGARATPSSGSFSRLMRREQGGSRPVELPSC